METKKFSYAPEELALKNLRLHEADSKIEGDTVYLDIRTPGWINVSKIPGVDTIKVPENRSFPKYIWGDLLVLLEHAAKTIGANSTNIYY